MVDVRRCEYCGRFFETTHATQTYCSDTCKRDAANETRRHKTKLKKRDGVNENQENHYVMNDARLKKYVEESIACGLSYGKYRMLKDIFHKTFEEIKNEYKDMSYLY